MGIYGWTKILNFNIIHNSYYIFMLYARIVCLFYLCILLVINYNILSIPLSKKKNVREYNEHIGCVSIVL